MKTIMMLLIFATATGCCSIRQRYTKAGKEPPRLVDFGCNIEAGLAWKAAEIKYKRHEPAIHD